MAVALIGAAKVALPMLLEGYQKHEAVVAAAKQCEVSLSKAEEMLNLETKVSKKNLEVTEARKVVEICINDMSDYLAEMSKTLPEAVGSGNNTDGDKSKGDESNKSMIGKAMDVGKKVLSTALDATKTSIEAVLIDRVAELSKLNSLLLVACVDLSLAIQTIPKSSICTLS